MPLEIVRNDITNMQVDAIVNSANPKPVIGAGIDAGIHKKAGEGLLAARKKIGDIAFGEAAITPAFGLNAKYVIHTAGPIWEDGKHDEEKLLASCYSKSLALAKENACKSVAFPMISTGNYGFPKPLALQIATREISKFILENDMQVYLVVFEKESFSLSEKLFNSVKSFIDERYIDEKTKDEYSCADIPGAYITDEDSARRSSFARRRFESAISEEQECESLEFSPRRLDKLQEPRKPVEHEPVFRWKSSKEMAPACASFEKPEHVAASIKLDDSLEFLLENLDAGFSETLLTLIDLSGKKDSEVYKKANVDRKLFSKIRNNPEYKPSKPTALAFAFALELDLFETKKFIGRAGYALSRSSKFDIIVEYFLLHRKYDIFELNNVLYEFDQPLIGA